MAYAAKVGRLAADTNAAQRIAGDILSEARTESSADLASWYTYPGEVGTSGLEASCEARLSDSGLSGVEAWLDVETVQDDLVGVTVVLTWGTGSPGGKVEIATVVSPRF